MVYFNQDPNSGGREIPHIAQIDHESGELESIKPLYIDGSKELLII
jgi:hypothetical protein